MMKLATDRTDEVGLEGRELELVAVGAAIAAGCVPCTQYHVAVARKAGASDVAIRWVMDEALRIRRRATEAMAELADQQVGPEASSEASALEKDPMVRSLVSLAAALGASFAAGVEAHLDDALETGAGALQVDSAMAMAKKIRAVAGEKAEAAASSVTGRHRRSSAVDQGKESDRCSVA